MEQVLYTKYNSMRQPAYRIITEIRENNGEKYVVKRAGEPAAEEHMHRMKENRKLLADAYPDIFVLPMEEGKTGIRFPFIQGKNLKNELIDGYTDLDQFVRETAEKLDRMLAVKPDCLCGFEQTQAFTTIFGNGVPQGSPAVCPANVDALFTNFMEQDGRLYCIDYEWVFDFPVPTGFIRYRALRYLHYELEKSLLDGITLTDFLHKFGIGNADQVLFEQMEYHFQFLVHGEKLKYHYLHRYQKAHESPVEIVEKLNCSIREKDTHIANLSESLRGNEKAVAELQNGIHKQDLAIQEQRQTIDDLNGMIHEQDHAIQEQRQTIDDLNEMIHQKDTQINQQKQAIHDKDVHIGNLDSMLRTTEALRDAYERQYQEISNAFFWRITKPARSAVIRIRTLAQKSDNVYQCLRFAKTVIGSGPRTAKANWKQHYEEKHHPTLAYWPSDDQYRTEQQTTFGRNIRFSILVPLYNTPEDYLTVMIDSVVRQTYGNWELCLADGSDAEHAYVGKICRKLARGEKRIKYRKLDDNRGISENTNACLDMATGDYIGLFDHDDLLHPSALHEYMQAICGQDADFLYSDENTFHETPADAYWPHYKPDYSPDTLRSYNYICHFTVFSRELLEKAGGGFRKEYDGSQDYDIILRLTEKAKHIVHIPKVLYYWRSHKDSTASDIAAKPYTMDAARAAIAAHLERTGLKGSVENARIPSTYKVQYEIKGNPLISIIIPNKDHADDLDKCLKSIREKSTWTNLEIIVVENNSTKQQTFDYYRKIEQDERIRVIRWEREFNYSAINNFGAQHAAGEYLLLLNNDIEIITPDWIEQMLMFTQRPDVGAAGAMLYYPDDTVQHAGVILGIGGVAGHSHKYFARGEYGYASRMAIAQNLSGVTAACIMIPRKVWDKVGGLDEGFAVAFNDVDLCMKIRQAGYLIVWTPFAELYHHESKSRGQEDNAEKQMRFKGEIDRFMAKWGKELEKGDPYYNPNLTLITEDFAFRTEREEKER